MSSIVLSRPCYNASRKLIAPLGCPSATRSLAQSCLLDGEHLDLHNRLKRLLTSRSSHTYTWLNNEKIPIKVPASQYISLVQRWIVGKIHDPKAFPTDNPIGGATGFASGDLNTPGATTPIAMGPTSLSTPLSTLAGHDWVGKKSGFPEFFFGDCKTIFRQIFRLYAHLYHSHWIDPFWHMTNGTNSNGWTDLNSCFVHYMSVAKLFGLLSDKDMEPMQVLIDIWITNGSIPADAANGACTIAPSL